MTGGGTLADRVYEACRTEPAGSGLLTARGAGLGRLMFGLFDNELTPFVPGVWTPAPPTGNGLGPFKLAGLVGIVDPLIGGVKFFTGIPEAMPGCGLIMPPPGCELKPDPPLELPTCWPPKPAPALPPLGTGLSGRCVGELKGRCCVGRAGVQPTRPAIISPTPTDRSRPESHPD